MKNREDNRSTKPVSAESFEREVFEFLVSKGYIIPETGAEVQRAEERMQGVESTLPEALRDPVAALEGVKRRRAKGARNLVPFPTEQMVEAQEDLARAARKGGNIAPEVEERMRRDREKAEAGLDGAR